VVKWKICEVFNFEMNNLFKFISSSCTTTPNREEQIYNMLLYLDGRYDNLNEILEDIKIEIENKSLLVVTGLLKILIANNPKVMQDYASHINVKEYIKENENIKR